MGAKTPKSAAVKDAEKRVARRAESVLASADAYLQTHVGQQNTKRALDDLRRDTADWHAARAELVAALREPADLPVSPEFKEAADYINPRDVHRDAPESGS